MQKSQEGLHAATALAALREDGIDPSPYFGTVADSLLLQHGVGALRLAAAAIDRFGRAGDSESAELWREVAKRLWLRAEPFLATGTEAFH